EVGRHHQVAHEHGVFLHLDRPHRDLRVAVHVVEQADAQVTGETLVDQLHRGHAPTDDAFLRGQVVGANALRASFVRGGFVRLPGDAAHQGVYFFHGEKVRSHGGSPYWMMNEVNSTECTGPLGTGCPAASRIGLKPSASLICSVMVSASAWRPSMVAISEGSLLDSSRLMRWRISGMKAFKVASIVASATRSTATTCR